ncbi:MAG: glycosyltransferase family 2 protein [Chthoniobacterales bacterium]
MSRPFFCICMPTFNRAHVIRDAIDSVIGQTFKDWRLVVLDNHSTDGTWDLLNREYGNHPQIRLFRNDRNIGGYANLDRCIELADGEWLGILADDDAYRLHAFETIHKNTADRNDLVIWAHGQFLHTSGARPHVMPIYNDLVEFAAGDLASMLYRRGNMFGVLSSYFLHCDSLHQAGVTFSEGTLNVDVILYVRLLKAFPQKKMLYWPDILTSAEIGEETGRKIFEKSGAAQLDIVEHIGVLANLGWPRKLLLWQLARVVKCSLNYARILARTSRGRNAPFVAARRILKALPHAPQSSPYIPDPVPVCRHGNESD